MFTIFGNTIIDVLTVFFSVFIVAEIIIRIVKKRLKKHEVKSV